MRPLRAAAAVRVENRTHYPTAEIRRLLAAAFRRRQPELVRVRMRARGSTAAGATSPTGRVVDIGLHGGPYPITDHYTGLAGAPEHDIRSWRDELALIAAHEAAHVDGIDDELVAERRAARYLARRRGRTVTALTLRWRRR